MDYLLGFLIGLTFAFLVRLFFLMWANRNKLDNQIEMPLWQWIVGCLAIVAICLRASCT